MDHANIRWMSDKRYGSDLTDQEYAILRAVQFSDLGRP
jgi:hypothetical protein